MVYLFGLVSTFRGYIGGSSSGALTFKGLNRAGYFFLICFRAGLMQSNFKTIFILSSAMFRESLYFFLGNINRPRF